jgi:hypothetical protein
VRRCSQQSTPAPARIREEILLKKDGQPVDYDIEGVAQRADGSFWLVSEGSVEPPPEGSEEEPSVVPNLLLEVTADGTVGAEIELPADVAALQRNNGYEGVAVTGDGEEEQVYVAFQREWENDPAGMVRIGRYTPASGRWAFAAGRPISRVQSFRESRSDRDRASLAEPPDRARTAGPRAAVGSSMTPTFDDWRGSRHASEKGSRCSTMKFKSMVTNLSRTGPEHGSGVLEGDSLPQRH